MRVVTFNIQHGRRPDGVVDLGALAAWCAEQDADMLALQEVDVGVKRSARADTVTVVREASGMDGVFAPAMPIGRGQYGNALLVRGEMREVEVVVLPDTEDEARVMVLTRAAIGATVLTVATTHLDYHRAGARTQLAGVLELLADREGPVLLVGDLNLGAEDVQRVMTASASELELVGPFDPTWPAHEPARRLDHVLVRGLSAGLALPLDRAPVSDHLALACELSLRGDDRR